MMIALQRQRHVQQPETVVQAGPILFLDSYTWQNVLTHPINTWFQRYCVQNIAGQTVMFIVHYPEVRE